MTVHSDKAAQLKDEAGTLLDAIRADSNLAERGKLHASARIQREYAERIAALKELHETEVASERNKLMKSVVGLPDNNDPMAMISYRDAHERAERLANLEGNREEQTHARLQALKTAMLSGDAHLGKAILALAIQNRWGQVVQEYVDHNPGQKDGIDRLWEASVPSTRDKLFGDAFHFPPRGILEGLGENQITNLAESEGDEVVTDILRSRNPLLEALASEP